MTYIGAPHFALNEIKLICRQDTLYPEHINFVQELRGIFAIKIGKYWIQLHLPTKFVVDLWFLIIFL